MGSRDILQMRARDMAGYSFDCDCGRHHSVDIKKIVVQNGVTSIGSYALAYIHQIESVSLPNTLTKIGD